MASYKYIIGRYNEDINWLKENTDVFENTIIINKGESLNIDNEILLENFGREGASYLYYIITNYDNLPDVCIFSQAKISDHIVYNEYGSINSLIKLKEDALLNQRSQYTYIVNSPYWVPDWNLIFPEGHLRDIHMNVSNYKNNQVVKFIDWFNIHIKSNCKIITRFYPCGIFAVSKNLILLHPKEYYENLLNELNWLNNPIEGGFLERSWYHIFNPSFIE